MTNPEDEIYFFTFVPGDEVPTTGFYRAFRADNNERLKPKIWYEAHQRFECWPSDPRCGIRWSGPVKALIDDPDGDGSEEPRRVADDAAVAD